MTDENQIDNEPSLEDFVASQCDGFMTGFAIIATYVDEDGTQRYWGDTMTGQNAMVTLGLMETGAAIERRRITDEHFVELEDGDES